MAAQVVVPLLYLQTLVWSVRWEKRQRQKEGKENEAKRLTRSSVVKSADGVMGIKTATGLL